MSAGTRQSGQTAVVDHQARILAVEDDPAERAILIRALGPWAATVRVATNVAEALAACAAEEPDVVILELGLPDGHGLDVVRRIRTVSHCAVIVHSGVSAEGAKVAAFDAGADDYLTKPVGVEELRARVRLQLRRLDAMRGAPTVAWNIASEDLAIDILGGRVVRGGVEHRLTPTEAALLRVLLLNAGRTITHGELWKLVWDREYGNPQLHLRVRIAHLRRKIEERAALPRMIVTEPGVGYRFVLP